MASPRSQLTRARDERRLVRVVRGKGWTRYDGYVAAVSKKWCVLRVVVDGVPDGLVIVRTKDVRALRKPWSDRTLSKAALAAAGQWPPLPPKLLDLHDVRTVLFTAGSLGPVVGYATEDTRPGTFHVGYVFRITQRRVWIGEINPHGRHRRLLSDCRLEQVTRVDVGSAYLQTVARVAG
jgi:hypothetical protein